MGKNKTNFSKDRLKIILTQKNLFLYLIIFVSITVLIYAFVLANKRSVNFEFGKFDLGNMAQMVWNTGHGRFMEITDQFGTNMPRWGMSHVDPILLIFVPLYLLFPYPMSLVFFQQLIVISAVIPIFFYLKKNIKSEFIAFLVSLTYLLYPSIGYTLIWTGFHGISFIAPLLIWLYWFLDKYNFLVENKRKKLFVIYWTLIVLMLFGKEEVGSMLSIFSVFLYFKNKKLAIQTFAVSFVWFVMAFFVIIPNYSHLRESSVDSLIAETNIENVKYNDAKYSNFFINRYSYLGKSYGEMVLNSVKNPLVPIGQIFSEDNRPELLYTFGPFAFIVLLNPFWLVSLPDLLIGLLSSGDGFNITNHRVGFVTSVLFLSYLLILKRVKFFKNGGIYVFVLSVIVFLSTIFTSHISNNPLFLSGESLFQNKILNVVFAGSKITEKKELGDIIKSKTPTNTLRCLNSTVNYIYDYNPVIYSGPDYLGAQASNRYVNALFPSRISDADMVIADVYDAKIYYAMGSDNWDPNIIALKSMFEKSRYVELYSCDQMAVFVPNEKENSLIVNDLLVVKVLDEEDDHYLVEGYSGLIFSFYPIMIPTDVSLSSNSFQVKFGFKYLDGNDEISRVQPFWNIRDKDGNSVYKFIDYTMMSSSGGFIDMHHGDMFIEERPIWIPQWVESGDYDLYFGVGNLVRAKEVLVGSINIK